ncbi:SET domain protein [Penicillium brasilianum]|uniref:SET domain protein n=1 Tax=Penicillium brasilianum TaxID=104259 RepID=A0A1S9RPP2_PENBI|nr:SET domain protein [Penicillium brasilianum]
MSSSAHFPDPSSFQHQSDRFVAWLEASPGVKVNPKICLADLRSTGAGRGVVARTSIAEGEELFSIPRNLILAVQNSELKNLLGQDVDALGPWLSLMLVMLYEYSQGANSRWEAYFQVLPTRFDTLMFWSQEELHQLQASAIVDKIGKQGADESILQSIVPIVRANPGLFPPVNGVASYEGDAGAAALLELAHIMGSLIMAYAFDIEKSETEEDEVDENDESYMTDDEDEQLPKGMVPLADLLNADADRNNARLFQEEECLVMKAIKPIHEGEEIFNDYGEIPRADLLRRYGYVTDNYSQYDVIELPLRDICRAAGLSNSDVESQPRLELLEENDVLDDGYVIPRPAPNASLQDILPAELVILLTTLSLTPEEFDQRRSKNKLPKPAMESNQASLLFKILQTKQAQYGSSLGEDMQLLSSLLPPNAPASLDGSARRHKIALQVRIGEKEVLQAILAMLEPLVSGGSLKRSANGDTDTRQFKAARV